MKYYKLTSNVAEGHYINDLRLEIPYEGNVFVKYFRAKRSAELLEAIRENLVSVEEVLQEPDQNPSLGSKDGSEKRTQKEEKDEENYSVDERKKDSQPKKLEDLETLKGINKKLMLTVQELVNQNKKLSEKQEKLIEKMDQFVENEPRQVVAESERKVTPSKPENPSPEKTFIPSVESEAKTSGDIEMEEENEKSSSSIDEAAEAMEELDKGN